MQKSVSRDLMASIYEHLVIIFTMGSLNIHDIHVHITPINIVILAHNILLWQIFSLSSNSIRNNYEEEMKFH